MDAETRRVLAHLVNRLGHIEGLLRTGNVLTATRETGLLIADTEALLAARPAAPDLVEELADAKEAFRLSTENLAVECDKYDALVALVRALKQAKQPWAYAAAVSALLAWEAPDGR